MANAPLFTTRSKRSNLVHAADCHYLMGRNVRCDMTELQARDVLASQHRFCQHCSPVAKKYRAQRKELEALATQSGISIRQKHGLLYITSQYDQWLVVPNASMQSIAVYHKNTLEKPGPKPAIPGYHYQDFRCSSLLQALKSIENHDAYKRRIFEERRERKEQERKEAEQAKQLAYEASVDYYKKKGKNNHTKKSGPKSHESHAKAHVIKADPCDWESFRALFRPNAAE